MGERGAHGGAAKAGASKGAARGEVNVLRQVPVHGVRLVNDLG